MIGAWILYMHVVLDGASTMMQDRFQTEAACEQAAIEIRREIGSDYGVRTKSHLCINDGSNQINE